MANTKLLGNKVNAYLDVAVTGAPEWKLVACITESDIDQSRETIDTSSKCGPGQEAGNATNTANLTGFLIIDPEVNQVTMNDLAELFDSANSAHWKYEDEDGGNVYYREFNGPLTAFNEASNNNEAVTFTLSIAINGDIIRTLPVS